MHLAHWELRTCDEWSESFCDWQAFANRSVDEVKEIRILVHSKPSDGSAPCHVLTQVLHTYRLAAFAVSMTLPPPTLQTNDDMRRHA